MTSSLLLMHYSIEKSCIIFVANKVRLIDLCWPLCSEHWSRNNILHYSLLLCLNYAMCLPSYFLFSLGQRMYTWRFVGHELRRQQFPRWLSIISPWQTFALQSTDHISSYLYFLLFSECVYFMLQADKLYKWEVIQTALDFMCWSLLPPLLLKIIRLCLQEWMSVGTVHLKNSIW